MYRSQYVKTVKHGIIVLIAIKDLPENMLCYSVIVNSRRKSKEINNF